jgi:uncharacterized protein YjbJ (UPF0337 family)
MYRVCQALVADGSPEVDWRSNVALVPDHAADPKETVMGLDDKIKNAAQDLTGKGKEAVGDMTDNERLEAEGERDQAEANLKKAGENVKDAFR